MASDIQWTDETWNPTTGCTKISSGCANCYIERTPPMRMAGRKFVDGKIPLQLHEDRLDKPLHWKKPRRIFVNSMSDLFHEDVPDEFIDRVFATMALCPQHTFQVLTKRSQRMARYAGSDPIRRGYLIGKAADAETCGYPLPNVWLGVSVENQEQVDKRIPHLLATPAAVRFLSCEPLLSRVSLHQHMNNKRGFFAGVPSLEAGGKTYYRRGDIDWIIIGGESGPGARPCDVACIRSLIAQCKAAVVDCFVKQLGSCPFDSDLFDDATADNISAADDTACQLRLRDKKGGSMEEWPDDLRVREMPK